MSHSRHQNDLATSALPRHRLPRRVFLRGMLGGFGSVSVALPSLDAMFNGNGTALADGRDIPRRFVIWFWGNGNEPQTWTPAGLGRNWTPSYALEPLADIKHRVSVVTGMTLGIRNKTNPHVEGAVAVMGGTNPIVHPSFSGSGVWDYLSHSGETIDQVVGKALGKETPYRTLEFGATPHHPSFGPGQAVSYISHSGPFAPNPYSPDPAQVFARLFGPSSVFKSGAERPIDLVRGSILDAVLEDATALEKRLGAADRLRLQGHMDALRGIERRIGNRTMAPPQSCRMPAEPMSGVKRGDTENARLIGELLAMALACDLTRVATFQFSSPASHEQYDNISAPLVCNGKQEASFHEFQHCVGFTPLVKEVLRYFVARFADFVRIIDGVPEGAGTLLDNTCVWGTSEVADGWTHKHVNMPALIAGSAGGRLLQGLHVPVSGDAATTNLLRIPLTLMHAMGMSPNSWGQDQFKTSTVLPDILA